MLRRLVQFSSQAETLQGRTWDEGVLSTASKAALAPRVWEQGTHRFSGRTPRAGSSRRLSVHLSVLSHHVRPS